MKLFSRKSLAISFGLVALVLIQRKRNRHAAQEAAYARVRAHKIETFGPGMKRMAALYESGDIAFDSMSMRKLEELLHD